MKKIISACLALILLQFSGTVYAGFTPKSFSGPYGGVFSGDIYASVIPPGTEPVIGPIGNLTMTFQLIADGFGNAVGTASIIVGVMVNGALFQAIAFAQFECNIFDFDANGQGILQCAVGGIGDVAAFSFVIVDSQPLAEDVLGIELGHHPHRVNNLLFNGSIANLEAIAGFEEIGQFEDVFVNGTGQLNSQFK